MRYPTNKTYTVAGMAALFRVDVKTIRRWTADKRLPPPQREGMKMTWTVHQIIWVLKENCRWWFGESDHPPIHPLPAIDEAQARAFYSYLDRLELHLQHDLRSEQSAGTRDALAEHFAKKRREGRARSRARQIKRLSSDR